MFRQYGAIRSFLSNSTINLAEAREGQLKTWSWSVNEDLLLVDPMSLALAASTEAWSSVVRAAVNALGAGQL